MDITIKLYPYDFENNNLNALSGSLKKKTVIAESFTIYLVIEVC